MSEESQSKELAALDAIIAASLAGRRIEDVTDEELLKISEDFSEISEEGRKILENLGPSPFSRGATNSFSGTPKVREEQFAGMYREGSDEGLTPELKKEIEEKRAKIRARLKAKREGDV